MIKHLLSLIIGGLLALSFFKKLFLIVPFLLIIIIYYFLKNNRFYKKTEFLIGLLTFVLVHSHWYISLSSFIGLQKGVLVWLGVSLYFFVLWYLFFYFLHIILKIPKGYFLIPVLWTLFEWVLSLGIFGYSFMSIYLTQAGTSLQWLSHSIIGSYAISFYVLTFSTLFALVFTKKISNKINILLFGIFFFIIFLVAVDSYYQKVEINHKTINIAVLQPNINQVDKMNENKFEEHLEKYLELINTAIIEKPETDIIVLPENIIPALWENNIKERLSFSTNLTNRLCVFGQPVKRGDHIFNAILFYKQGKYVAEYHKRQLVPFGEYIPFISDWVNLDDLIHYSSGSSLASPISIKSLKVLPLICFESAFSYLTPYSIIFDLGIIVTNDAWFNKHFKELHLRTAQFRAAESFRPFVYSANNGISALIDYNGKIISFVPDRKTGYVFSEVKVPTGDRDLLKSLFFYFPFWVLLFLLAMLLERKR